MAICWSWMRHFCWFLTDSYVLLLLVWFQVWWNISRGVLSLSSFWFLISGKLKGAAVHHSTWRVEQRSAGGWPLDKPAAVDYTVGAISKPPVLFARNWKMIGKLVCLLLLSHSHQPIVATVPRWWRFEATLSLLNVLGVAGRSAPCFFWQGPVLGGLSNRTSMSSEK